MKKSPFQILRLCLLGWIPLTWTACSSANDAKPSSLPSSEARGFSHVLTWNRVEEKPNYYLSPELFELSQNSQERFLLRSFALDLDPWIQKENILNRAIDYWSKMLHAQASRSGDTLRFQSAKAKGIALIGESNDSLWLKIRLSPNPLSALALDSLGPKLNLLAPKSIQKSTGPSIDGLMPLPSASTLAGSYSLGDSSTVYRGIDVQILSNMGREDWIKNILLGFEIEPSSVSGHWSSEQGLQIYRFQGEHIQGQAWLSGDSLRLVWTSANSPQLKKFQPQNSNWSFSPSTQAALLNLQGLQLSATGDNLNALAFYEKAFALDSSEIVYLVNCAFVYQSEGLYGPGLKHLSKYPELLQRSSRLSRAMGGLNELSYNYQKALDYYQHAEKFLYEDEENRIDLSDALWGLGLHNPSLDQVLDLYEQSPSPRLGLYVGKTLIGMDEYESAVKILREVKKKWGVQPELRQHLALALTLMDQNEAALAEAAAMTKENPDSCEYWFLRGQIEYNLRKFKQAATSLDRALSLQKDYADAYTLRSRVAAYLGESQFAPHARPTSPVEALPPIKEMLFRDFPQDLSPESPRIHTRKISYQYQVKSGWKKTETLLMEIPSAGALASMDELSYKYLPGYDQFYPNAILILDSNLNFRSSVPLSAMSQSGEKTQEDSSESRIVHIPLKALKKGDFLLVQVTYQSPKGAQFPFVNHKSSSSLPLGLDQISIYADTSDYRFEQYGEMQLELDKGNLRRWKSTLPTVLQKESYMPNYTEYGTGVMLAPKQSWNQAGTDYYQLIKRQLGSSLTVEEKAYELKGSLSDPYAIAQRMNEWVKSQIDYEHIRFGNHSIIPTRASQTLKNRRGDCKDKSVLLQALLAAANIQSELALISLEDQVFEGMVSTEQFDHMIVHVPAQGLLPEMWLDPSEGPNTLRPIPYDLENKLSLILAPEGKSRIELTPTLDVDEVHGGSFDHRIAYKGEKLQFRDSIQLSGKFADYFRTELGKKDEESLQHTLQKWMESKVAGIEIQKAQMLHPLDYQKDFGLVVVYELPAQVASGTSSTLSRLPLYWENLFLNLGKGKTRNFPLRLPQEHLFSSHFQALSPGMQLSAPAKIAGDYVNLDCKNSTPSEVQCQWSTKAALVNPEDFGHIYDEWENLSQNLQLPWLLP